MVVLNLCSALCSCRVCVAGDVGADGLVNSGRDAATGVASQTLRRLHTPRQLEDTLAYVRLGPFCVAR